MPIAVKILLAIAALGLAVALLAVWFFFIYPLHIEPMIADRNIAIAQSALRKGMTRDEVKAMIGKQIPQPNSVSAAGSLADKGAMPELLIEYRYKDELCMKRYKTLDIRFVNERAVSWRVYTWGLSCFN